MLKDQMPVIYSIDQAPAHILLHMVAAMAAVIIGAAVLFRQKGTHAHRILGRMWIGLMFVVAFGSFFIQVRGRFSLIHLLSVLIIVNLASAIYAIRNNNPRRHKNNMRIAYASLCIAGMFTLLPYRMLGRLVLG
jgi:uncharacterized membrane protein